MNQITDPDEISYKQARKKLGKLAPIVLITDAVLASIIWLFRNSIFPENGDYLGTLIAVGLLAAGVFSFFILKAMEKRVVRSGPANKETKDDIKD